MTVLRFCLVCVFACVIAPVVMTLQCHSLVTDVDWPRFMSRQDMVWDSLPGDWSESAFMGNGRLGLMIYKEPGSNCLRFETGNCDVHDHRERRDVFGVPRLLTGHFALHPKGKILGGTMRLDLWNAETYAQIITSEGSIRLKAMVHADSMIIAVRAIGEGNERGFTWQWNPARADSPRYLLFKRLGRLNKIPHDYTLNPEPEISYAGDMGLSVQKLTAGGETTVGWQETADGDSARILWINLTHTYPGSNSSEISQRTIGNAIRKGYEAMRQSHNVWWHSFYPRSFVTLPESQKENFYWIQMYKLASATRGDRALIDNTGPWLTETPWPNAWWNLNVQLTYWALNASDHLDLAESLENALYNNVEQLRLNIHPDYRHNSLGIGVASNMECMTSQVGVPGREKAQIGLLPWACHNLWLIYRHKMDDDVLRHKLYPLLKGAINYYLHFLTEGDDGRLHLPSTFSPEYGSAQDCNFDLALLRWGCLTLMESAARLKMDDPMCALWNDVLERLTPFPADDDTGLLIGKDEPYRFSHRHYSHLLAIYPLYLINVDKAGDKDLMEKSLEFWQSKPKALLGYSCTGASSISSAMGRGNEALRHLNRLFGRFLSPTTMYKESGPVIETPLSGAQSIHDMLLQSWGGKLRVFPALPDSWTNVAYSGLRTEGAFKVSASRRHGRTEFVHIRSLAGEPCIVVTDIPAPAFTGNREFTVVSIEPGTYSIDLRRNEEVFIAPSATSPEFIIKPLPHTVANHFGVK